MLKFFKSQKFQDAKYSALQTVLAHQNVIDVGMSVAKSISNFAQSKSPLSFIEGGVAAFNAGLKIISGESSDFFSIKNGWSCLAHKTYQQTIYDILCSALEAYPSKQLKFAYESEKSLVYTLPIGVVARTIRGIFYRSGEANENDILQFIIKEKIRSSGSKIFAITEQSFMGSNGYSTTKFDLIAEEDVALPSQTANDMTAYINRYIDAEVPRSIIFNGPPGCHEKGQLIMMKSGKLKKVEDIEVNDILMGPKGSPRKVLELRSGFGKMVKIKPRKGKEFTVNEDHILTLIKNNKKLGKSLNKNPHYEFIDVSVKDYLTWSNNQKNGHKLVRSSKVSFSGEKKILPIDPYILGALIGDGSLKKGAVITSMDPIIIDEFKKLSLLFDLNFHKIKGSESGKSYSYIAASSGGKPNAINDIIKSLKLNVNSGDKYIPLEYKTASIKNRLELLAGLIDTDGSLDKCNCFDYVSKSRQLTDDVVFIARSLGLSAYTSECTKSAHKNHIGTYYRACISGDISIIPTKLPRKQASPREQIKSVLYTGFTVEYTNADNFYGFTLDGDGRYLLDDFTITHNTGKTSLAHKVFQNLGLNVLKFKYNKNTNTSVMGAAYILIDIFKIDLILLDDFDYFTETASMLGFLEWLHRHTKVVIAITNSLKTFPPAILRPGRFDEVKTIECLDDNVIKGILGDLYDSFANKVDKWPVAYINELAIRARTNPDINPEEYIEELQGRVSAQLKILKGGQ